MNITAENWDTAAKQRTPYLTHYSHDRDPSIIICLYVEWQHYCGKSFSACGVNNSYKGEMLINAKTENKPKVQKLTAGIL